MDLLVSKVKNANMGYIHVDFYSVFHIKRLHSQWSFRTCRSATRREGML